MPVSGKKRSRKAEDDGSKKKLKSGDPVTAKTAPAAPVAAPMQQSFSQKALSYWNRGGGSTAAKKEKEEDNTVGNPYEQGTTIRSPPSAAKVAKKPEKKKASTPTKTKKTKTTMKAAVDTNGTTSSAKEVTPVKGRRNPTSVPCILLLLVAILMWCTVTLLGLLLSERMDHELQIWTLRGMLHKSESINVPPPVEELEQHVKHWRGKAEQLEHQKKGMLKEFGEKLVNLEYME